MQPAASTQIINKTSVTPAKNILENQLLKALIANGDYLVSTDDFSGNINCFSRYAIRNQTGLYAGLVVSKDAPPVFVLIAEEETTPQSSQQIVSGFDTVKCKIDSEVFEVKQTWSPKNVQISADGTSQKLFWDATENVNVKNLFRALGNCSDLGSVKVQFSSSLMGGSYDFYEQQGHIESIKKLAAVYRDFYSE